MDARRCRSVRGSVSAYLDGELDSVERRVVDDHLGVCADCRREVEQLGRVTVLLRASRSEGPEAEQLWRDALGRAKGRVMALRPIRGPLPGFFQRVLEHPLEALVAMILVSVAVAQAVAFLGLEEEGVRLLSYVLSLNLG